MKRPPIDRSPHETFVQVPGSTALRIDTDQYLAAIDQSESLRITLLRYVQTVLVQAAQSTASNASHRVESRLARWLLMCHDRIDGDEIALTHEFISMRISADRSGVTVTLHILEGGGMITSKRGLVIAAIARSWKSWQATAMAYPKPNIAGLSVRLAKVRPCLRRRAGNRHSSAASPDRTTIAFRPAGAFPRRSCAITR